MKPIKSGFMVADSNNGYFSRFKIYTEKTGGSIEHGLGARVVKTLTSELKGKHHQAFFDDYFTSWKTLPRMTSKVVGWREKTGGKAEEQVMCDLQPLHSCV